ncbi:MAG TPA: magnesium transporter CorA family protein [Candidatus Saccharibacteria bacterium]|nr:magnesium transporter CorA family protein [Candidatus Saccharibacteria bacterium]HRK93784.1 magnesium transporter CorA family protein [Candidatus Saccharibacteria bacterium]
MLQYLASTKADPVITPRERLITGSWVRSERPTDDEKKALSDIGIDDDILTDALDPHEVPRVETDDGWTYFITRVPDIGDEFNDFTTPIMVAISSDYLVTVSRDTLGRLWQPFIDKTRINTRHQATLFIGMMDMIAQSYQNRVSHINRQTRAATSDVRQLRSRDIGILTEYERKLNDYLDALLPTNTAVERMLGGRMLKLSEEDKDMVENLSIDLEQVIARCKSLLRTITNLRDSYRAVMDTRLNETIRLLTVITLALTIPTMLAGLFGMNVVLPGDENSPLAFWMIVGVSLVSAGSLSLYFLRKR